MPHVVAVGEQEAHEPKRQMIEQTVAAVAVAAQDRAIGDRTVSSHTLVDPT